MLAIILLFMSCAHQMLDTTSTVRTSEDKIAHKWVDTDLDRYIMYQDGDVVADEYAAEDIRVISTSYDKWSDSKILIRSTHDPESAERVRKVRELLVAFGVSDEDIGIHDIREELWTEEDILHVSLDINSLEEVYAKTP